MKAAIEFSVGDRVHRRGSEAVGTVIKVVKRERPGLGGVRAYVRVRWDFNGHEGSVEDRSLLHAEKK